MTTLYDSDADVAAAVALLKARGPILTPEMSAAIRAVLEDRERLLGVAALARKVRAAQRVYFVDRTTEALQTSKGLERDLDNALKD